MSSRSDRNQPMEPLSNRLDKVIPIRRLTPSESAQHSQHSVSPSPSYRQPPVRPLDPDGEDRSLCLDCYGKGCNACGHTGRVCPVCRGLRFVRLHEWSNEHPWCGAEQHNVIRCTVCMEGNNINPAKETDAIGAYLRRRQAFANARQQAH